jgi:hypothetical protein
MVIEYPIIPMKPTKNPALKVLLRLPMIFLCAESKSDIADTRV